MVLWFAFGLVVLVRFGFGAFLCFLSLGCGVGFLIVWVWRVWCCVDSCLICGFGGVCGFVVFWL